MAKRKQIIQEAGTRAQPKRAKAFTGNYKDITRPDAAANPTLVKKAPTRKPPVKTAPKAGRSAPTKNNALPVPAPEPGLAPVPVHAPGAEPEPIPLFRPTPVPARAPMADPTPIPLFVPAPVLPEPVQINPPEPAGQPRQAKAVLSIEVRTSTPSSQSPLPFVAIPQYPRTPGPYPVAKAPVFDHKALVGAAFVGSAKPVHVTSIVSPIRRIVRDPAESRGPSPADTLPLIKIDAAMRHEDLNKSLQFANPNSPFKSSIESRAVNWNGTIIGFAAPNPGVNVHMETPAVAPLWIKDPPDDAHRQVTPPDQDLFIWNNVIAANLDLRALDYRIKREADEKIDGWEENQAYRPAPELTDGFGRSPRSPAFPVPKVFAADTDEEKSVKLSLLQRRLALVKGSHKAYFERRWESEKQGMRLQVRHRLMQEKAAAAPHNIDYEQAVKDIDEEKLENIKAWSIWKEDYVDMLKQEEATFYTSLGVKNKKSFQMGSGAQGQVFALSFRKAKIRIEGVVVERDLVTKIGPRKAINYEKMILERLRMDNHLNIINIFTGDGPEKLDTENYAAILLESANRADLETFLHCYNWEDPNVWEKRSSPAKIPEPLIWSFMFDMLSALTYCHFGIKDNKPVGTGLWTPILHGDIKPANILINYMPSTGEHRAILCDFGASDFHYYDMYDGTSEDSLSDMRRSFMTFEYVPPEYPRTSLYYDVYSLGVSFHYALTCFEPLADTLVNGISPYNERRDGDYSGALEWRQGQAIVILPIHRAPTEWQPLVDAHYSKAPYEWQVERRSNALAYHIYRMLGIAYREGDKSRIRYHDRLGGKGRRKESIPLEPLFYRPHAEWAFAEFKEDYAELEQMLLDNNFDQALYGKEILTDYINDLIPGRDEVVDRFAVFHRQLDHVPLLALSQTASPRKIIAQMNATIEAAGNGDDQDSSPGMAVVSKSDALQGPILDMQDHYYRYEQYRTALAMDRAIEAFYKETPAERIEQKLDMALELVENNDQASILTKFDAIRTLRRVFDLNEPTQEDPQST